MSEKESQRATLPVDGEFWTAWAERAESDDFNTPASAHAFEGDAAEEEIGGLLDEVFSDGELASIGRGRPALNRPAGSGESPKRQVRLSRELDAALTAAAVEDRRRPSTIIRDALSEYLAKKAS